VTEEPFLAENHAGRIEKEGADVRMNPAARQITGDEGRTGPAEKLGIGVGRLQRAADRVVECVMQHQPRQCRQCEDERRWPHAAIQNVDGGAKQDDRTNPQVDRISQSRQGSQTEETNERFSLLSDLCLPLFTHNQSGDIQDKSRHRAQQEDVIVDLSSVG
jgi:hypothetical protein